jgi:signal transduction histidine kinase
LKDAGSPNGLGVGLAFCRLAVEGHGGKIRVESRNGQGSKFIITLPLANKQ